MIAEFIHYYPGYTVKSVLNEYAVTFYSLLSAMYRIKAKDDLNEMYINSASYNGGDVATEFIKGKEKQAGGGHKLLKEVEAVRSTKK